MPYQLDDRDVSILKSLLKDGRKSFRQVSRETGLTTPTVKARFKRLVNVGFVKSVSPIFDFDIIEKENILKPKFEIQGDYDNRNAKAARNETERNNRQEDIRSIIKRGLRIKLDCDSARGLFLITPMFSGLQTLSDFSVVLAVCLDISKSMLEE
jgi:DNA-binding Lrp family transcriptional regulator